MSTRNFGQMHGMQMAFDALHFPICLINLRGKILLCNSAMAALLGKKPGEIVGQRCFHLVHGENHPVDQCPLLRMSKSGLGEREVLSLNGRWFEVTVDPVRDRHGRVFAGVHTLNEMVAGPTPPLLNGIPGQVRKAHFLPVCAKCKRIRESAGGWERVEDFIGKCLNLKCSHSLCPECVTDLYPDLAHEILEGMNPDDWAPKE